MLSAMNGNYNMIVSNKYCMYYVYIKNINPAYYILKYSIITVHILLS